MTPRSLRAAFQNSDIVTHTCQGFDDYFAMDARVSYQLDTHWNLALGIDNLNDRDYFLFHPFPWAALSSPN